nr:molybdopterin molybdotransferase MoeA [Parvularcula dongshanensis]
MVQEALARIASAARPLGEETAALAEAQGRVLALPARAGLTHPPAAVSAMDGYAVRRPDPCPPGTRFTVIGGAPAGAPFAGSVGPGEAVRIFTGSVLPDGADHVVMQEETERAGGEVRLTAGQPEARNVRPAGGDFAAGDVLLPRGRALSAVDLALLAAANLPSVTVFRRPKIAYFSNGDELVPPGSDLAPGQVVTSTPFALSGLLRDWGAAPLNLGTAGDTPASVEAMFDRAEAEGADVVVPIGGASVGDYDFAKAAGRTRFDLAFEKVAVRPGKPVWFGKSGKGYVLGLPGNPASALACAVLFLKPLLYALTGRDALAANPIVEATLTAPVGQGSGREHYMRAVVRAQDGILAVTPQSAQDTSLLSPFAASNALLRRMAGAPAAETGERAEVILFGPL